MISPQLANIVAEFVDCQLTRSDAVVGGGVAGALEVGAVHRGRRSARLCD